nr:NADH dehydrogenase subunit 2 [Chalcopteryx rutilans]
MTPNLSMMLFSTSLIMGTMITISTSSWLIMWMGLEMNLLSFIPMMNSNKTSYESESSMKYFLTQAMASIMIMMAVLLSGILENMNEYSKIIILAATFTKMGAAPFHLWFPSVMQGLTWNKALILMTWQKIAPMGVMSHLMVNSTMINMVAAASVTLGTTGGLNQTSMRKMMAYSSVSHLGWMIMSMMMSNALWTMYFITYSLLNTATLSILKSTSTMHLPQLYSHMMNTSTKFALMTTILSLGGLPPFLGFLPKWIIIQNMVLMNSTLMVTIMVMTTLITLYFYLRMAYSAFMINSQSTYWKMSSKQKKITALSAMISIAGIPLATLMNYT